MVKQDHIAHSLECHTVDDLVWVGNSAASASLITSAIRAARLDSTLLLTGERGTGKQLLARMIHAYSSRRDAPFIEFELTGTEDSVSECFERAGRGIMYVDQIEHRPPEVQRRLVHVLGTKSPFRPRMIASSSQELRSEVKAGRFENRLFYLFGAQLEVPPLRKRAGDIRMLIAHFQQQIEPRNVQPILSFTAESLSALERYDWPGNVRELRLVVESATGSGSAIEPADLPVEIARRTRTLDPETMTLWAMERQHIQRVLRLTGGRLTRAAELLGIHRNTLRRKIDQYAIEGGDQEN